MTSDHDGSLFDIQGDVFTAREAARYLKTRGVANTANILVILREHYIFRDDPGTRKERKGFKTWAWRVSREALDAYIVWYRAGEVRRNRRAYRVDWTEREYAIACDVLTAVGVPIPGRIRRYRDDLYKLNASEWTDNFTEED